MAIDWGKVGQGLQIFVVETKEGPAELEFGGVAGARGCPDR